MTSDSATIDRTIEHLCKAIDTAEESREPFGYLRLVDLFPPDVYAQMLAEMPTKDDYRRMSGRARSSKAGDVRTKLDLFPEWTANLPAEKRGIWEVVGESLRSARVRDAFMRRLAPGLERRFGAEHATVGMFPIPVLTRDVAGYKIGIHPDTRYKGMTIQIYLPRDRSIEHVEPVFHKRTGERQYEVSARMPFSPNSGYAFAVGDNTYHSVDKVGEEVETRDSILLTYFVDRTLIDKIHNRGKRFGNYLLAKARGPARKSA